MTLNLLMLDTSLDACSAAVLSNHKIFEQYQMAPKQHTQLILPMIHSVLTEANITLNQLNAIAFGCGPGNFTGIRIAAGITQGLALSADLPVIPISTLQIIAQGVYQETGEKKILVAIDAHMQEIYWGVYQLNDKAIMEPVVPDSVCVPTKVKVPKDNDWLGVGNAWKIYSDLLKEKFHQKIFKIDEDRMPHAADIVYLAKEKFLEKQVKTVYHAIPNYLRDNSAWKKFSGA